MKKLWFLSIVVGLLAFVAMFLISAYSEQIDETIKTIGFIIIGYIGVISFVYGWKKYFGKK